MAVDSTSRDYQRMQDRWRTARDCVEGSHAIKGAGTRYLPALAGHNPNNRNDPYWGYVERALFYGATARTVDGLVGMVFRRPPVVDVPTKAEALLEDVDMLGRPLEDFSKALLREVLVTGRAGVLVEHTRPPAEPRPYLRLYATEDILDVVEDVIGGAVVPVQVRLRECYDVPKAGEEFETEEIQQIRVLELVDGRYGQRVFRQDANQTYAEVVDEVGPIDPSINGAPIDYIPFWVFSTDQQGRPGEVEPPPLIDLMDVNLAHYRQEADYRNALHFAGVPVFVVTGAEEPDGGFKVGAETALVIPNADAKAAYVGYGAEGATAIRASLDDLQQMMAFLGARMLQPEKRGIEAAETAAIHRQGEISVLGSIANGINGKLTQALQFMLEWALIPVVDGTGIALNNDYIPTTAQPALLAAMIDAWQKGAVSHDSLWTFMRDGELVDPRRTVEEEQALIDAEAPAPVPVQPQASAGNGSLVNQGRQADQGRQPAA